MSEPNRVCSCDDWKLNIDKVNGPIVLQSLRAGKDLFTGKPFTHCPWCGNPLQNSIAQRLTASTPVVSEKGVTTIEPVCSVCKRNVAGEIVAGKTPDTWVCARCL